MLKTIILNFLILSLLIGCNPALDSMPTATDQPVIEPAAAETAMPTVTPSPTSTPLPLDGQQTEYQIDAIVDYYNRFLSVTSQTIYTNKTKNPLNEILFIFYPTIFPGSFFIRSMKDGITNSKLDYTFDGHRMIIPLESPLFPGEQINIIHDYELYMPDRAGVFSQSGRQLNLSYWYPFIPPYDENEGWIAHSPHIEFGDFIGEFLVFESSDFDVTLQFTDRRENFKIAAGAIPTEQNGVINYKLDLARTFVLSISDAFVLVEREVNGIKIHSLAFTEHLSIAEIVADIAVDAILLFTELYGPYERDLITITEFNADIGMEFDGILFLSFAFYNLYPGSSRSNIHIYTAHEIAHQWFFSLVGNDQAIEPWLDEALSTYSELLFYENYYPENVDWWWDNYINFHNPSGPIDVTIYFGGNLHEYRNRVYRNGVRFLHDLREIMGDQAFFDFIKSYVEAHRYEIATGEDFWGMLMQYTDADLTGIMNEYFQNPPISIEP